METTSDKPRIAIDKLIIGLFLVVVGVATFLGTIDVWDFRDIWRFWPVFLIVFGLSGELEALRSRKSDGSYVLLAVGIWMLFGSLHLFGLSIGRAMPIGVMTAGLFVIVHALIDRPAIKEKENDNVC